MTTLKTMADVQDKGIVDGFEFMAAGGDQNHYKPTMRANGDTICGLNLIAQGHYETGFETGLTRWIDGWTTPLGN